MTLRMKVGALAAVALLAACGSKSGEYVKDGDTGAASPGAPDSTSGMSQRAGAPGVAGTRQGANGDSGIRSSSPASTTPGVGNATPKRP